MHASEREIFRKCLEWRLAGHGVAFATVVKTWGSSPRPVGSMLAIRDDGVPVGSVSGGCIDVDLIARVQAGLPTRPEVLDYGGSAEDGRRFNLPCGGALQLVLEPVPKVSMLQAILDTINRRGLIGRHLDLASGRTGLYVPQREDALRFDGRTLTTTHGPGWRLLLIGAGEVSQYLAWMAQALDYQVVVCDPREEYRAGWSVPEASVAPGMPDDVVNDLVSDQRCAVVALTHDPKLDDLALIEALKSPAFYVGALGSEVNNAKRRQRLRLFALEDAAIARLHGPVGLAIGSRTPPEIAISILAEMTAVRHGVAARGAQKRSERDRRQMLRMAAMP